MTTQNQPMTAAIAAFSQWRKTGVHPTEKTPLTLQQQAIALLDHYSVSQITATLNVSSTNLKRWAGLAEHHQDVTEFVALPHVVDPPPSPLNLELTFSNGCQLCLQGDISAELLVALTHEIHGQQGVPS